MIRISETSKPEPCVLSDGRAAPALTRCPCARRAPTHYIQVQCDINLSDLVTSCYIIEVMDATWYRYSDAQLGALPPFHPSTRVHADYVLHSGWSLFMHPWCAATSLPETRAIEHDSDSEFPSPLFILCRPLVLYTWCLFHNISRLPSYNTIHSTVLASFLCQATSCIHEAIVKGVLTSLQAVFSKASSCLEHDHALLFR